MLSILASVLWREFMQCMDSRLRGNDKLVGK
jgi:hypothetical protein